ncbi:MAG: hypothetical protein PHT69_13655 [Bacteroidales bacterium]|nr:hypothetical protein [Bacteroidales bacterium]
MKLLHKRNAYFFMSFFKLFLIFSLTPLIFVSGCRKTEPLPIKPELILVADTDCINSDTTLPMGTLMRFRIKANCESSPITNFVITYDNGTKNVFLDTGVYNNELFYTLEVIKGTSAIEDWQFSVMTKERETAKVSIQIALDSGGVFGNINTHTVILGAQNNTLTGHFYSFTNEAVYTLEQAYNNQIATDICYYFHTEYESTLSSPNDNDAPSIFTGTYGLSNWQIRNESRYNLTTIQSSEFDNIANDSLLIASYDIINAKRKGKNIETGQVWAFRIQSGKIGLIRVDTIVPETTGTVGLTIKIQE